MFEDCFEKHSFEDLNNGDLNILYNAIQFYFNKYGNSNTTFIDVGTNAGSFIKALSYFNIKDNIHCFEPHPVISQKTKEFYPYVNMNNYCLGNKDGYIDIFIPQWSIGLSSIIERPIFKKLEETQKITKINVKCQKLDTYCDLNNITNIGFLKIDVEGAEKMIFEGSDILLKNNKILCGIFEVGETLKDANTNEDEIINILEKYGYTINKNFHTNDYLFYL